MFKEPLLGTIDSVLRGAQIEVVSNSFSDDKCHRRKN